MMDKESIRNLHTPIHSWESVKIISGLITVLKQGRPPAPGGKFRLILNITPWIENSFTTCTQRFYLEPYFVTYHTNCSYCTPDPVSLQYLDTSVNYSLGIDCVLNLYRSRRFWNVNVANKANKGER